MSILADLHVHYAACDDTATAEASLAEAFMPHGERAPTAVAQASTASISALPFRR